MHGRITNDKLTLDSSMVCDCSNGRQPNVTQIAGARCTQSRELRMPLQNRVTPFGEIAALPGRGMLMGNRGILHGEDRNIVRFWQCRRWIACVLSYRGIRRTVMRPHSYTELFFLDEAAAFSAGHRPCAECRRKDYNRFKTLWESSHGGPVSAESMDAVLDAERRIGRKKRTYRTPIDALPDGAYVAIDGKAWLLWERNMHAWSDSGYIERRALPRACDVEVLTPPSIVAVFAAGYNTDVHPSVNDTR
jgi:hypothetical protein